MSEEQYSMEDFDSDDPLRPEELVFKMPRWKRYTTRGFVVCISAQLVFIVGAIIIISTSLPPPPEEFSEGTASFVLDSMDKSADPCNDFYQYACGGWIAAQEPLADYESRRTRSFDSLREKNDAILFDIITSGWPYIGTAFSLCNNTERLNERGLEPIDEYYTAIDGAESVGELFSTAGSLWLDGVDIGALFTIGVGVDDMQPSQYQLSVWQSGLTLPSPGYYTNTSGLAEWIQDVFDESPHGAITLAEAESIVAFETTLASLFYSVEQSRDPYSIQNPRVLSDLVATLGSVGAYFDPFNLDDDRVINAAQIGYIEALPSLVGNTSFSTLKLYTKLRLFDATFALLGEPQRALVDEMRHRIYGTLPSNRSSSCIGTTVSLFPMLIGKYYVDAVADGEKNAALTMIMSVESAFSDIIYDLEWMDDETKIEAQAKLAALGNKIAYPDSWPPFDELFSDVVFSDYFELITTMSKGELDHLDEPVDREKWHMSPSTVNAYYSPNMNEIVFPLAILQFPFFSPMSPAALNYGGFGVVAGHEISHGFDDSGAQFDANGALSNWWSNASRTAFETRVACIEAQYSEYSTAEGGHLSGVLTAGENIADAGGLEAAYRAYQENRGDEDVESMFGMSGDELFFVAYAQTWCELNRPEREALSAASDPHSFGRYRVEGVLSDSVHFAQTFECKNNDRYAEDTCEMWS